MIPDADWPSASPVRDRPAARSPMTETLSASSIWKHVRIGVTVAAALLVVVLILQNTESVNTRLLFVTVSMPRAVLLLTTLLVGFAAGVLVGYRWRRSLHS
jgi:uncharacterized integral membrane protein